MIFFRIIVSKFSIIIQKKGSLPKAKESGVFYTHFQCLRLYTSPTTYQVGAGLVWREAASRSTSASSRASLLSAAAGNFQTGAWCGPHTWCGPHWEAGNSWFPVSHHLSEIDVRSRKQLYSNELLFIPSGIYLYRINIDVSYPYTKFGVNRPEQIIELLSGNLSLTPLKIRRPACPTARHSPI